MNRFNLWACGVLACLFAASTTLAPIALGDEPKSNVTSAPEEKATNEDVIQGPSDKVDEDSEVAEPVVGGGTDAVRESVVDGESMGRATSDGESVAPGSKRVVDADYGRFGQRSNGQPFRPFAVSRISRHHARLVNRTPFVVQAELTDHEPISLPGHDYYVLRVKDVSREATLRFSYIAEDYELFREEGWQAIYEQLGPQIHGALKGHSIWLDDSVFGVPIPEDDKEKMRLLKMQRLAGARALREMEEMAKDIFMNTPVEELDLIKILGNAKQARNLVEDLIENERLYRASEGEWNRYSQSLRYEDTRYVRNDRMLGKRQVGRDVRGGPTVSAKRGTEVMGLSTTLIDENKVPVVEGVGFRATQSLGPESNIGDRMYLRLYGSAQLGGAYGPLRSGTLSVESKTNPEERESIDHDSQLALYYLTLSADMTLRATIRPRYILEGGVGLFGLQAVVLSSTLQHEGGGAINLGSRSAFDGIHPYLVGRAAWLTNEAKPLFPLRGSYVGIEVKSYIWTADVGYAAYLNNSRLSSTRTLSPQLDIALTWGTLF